LVSREKGVSPGLPIYLIQGKAKAVFHWYGLLLSIRIAAALPHRVIAPVPLPIL